ncbi:MAG: hypothetical protein ACE5GN_07055 [Waddliaceae bacterium]
MRLSIEKVLGQLEAFLKPRIEAAEREEFSSRSIGQIGEDVRRDVNTHRERIPVLPGKVLPILCYWQTGSPPYHPLQDQKGQWQ